jgi:hypothetical protein
MSEFICAECGHEQDSMDRTCDSCGSIRVVLASVTNKLMEDAGLTKEDCFGPVVWEEPEAEIEVASPPVDLEKILDDMKRQGRNRRKARRRKLRQQGYKV